MTLQLLTDPKSGIRWPADDSRVLFRHLSPTRWYTWGEGDALSELAMAHGWTVYSRPATTDEQIEFCQKHSAAWYDYEKREMNWRPVGV